jgi:hypothetical protein
MREAFVESHPYAQNAQGWHTRQMIEIDQSDLERYRVGWSDYVRRRNTLWIVFLGYLPLGALVMLSLKYLRLPYSIGMTLVIAWFLAFPIVGIRYQLWKCPRCGKGFAYTWWYNKSYFARKCVHCGLTKSDLARIAREGSQEIL